MGEEERQEVEKGKKKLILIVVLLFGAIALGIGAYKILAGSTSRGYEDYTVQKEQYYVEYSEQYDYWDVLTIEYPVLEGIDEERKDLLNQLMYDTAMDRTDYWHWKPDEEVREFQKEYTLFCSDVRCDVSYHSQYLLSVDFEELYAPVNPVYYTNLTERALNMDLMSGEVYELPDIFRIDEEFVDLWCKAANREYGDNLPYDSETCEVLFRWFTGAEETLSEYYDIRPFFFITSRKEFAVGIAMDPKLSGLTGGAPEGSVYKAVLTAADTEPYRTDSEFWEKYEKSQDAGRVFECLERAENLWLGDDAGVWKYWENR